MAQQRRDSMSRILDHNKLGQSENCSIKTIRKKNKALLGEGGTQGEKGKGAITYCLYKTLFVQNLKLCFALQKINGMKGTKHLSTSDQIKGTGMQ